MASKFNLNTIMNEHSKIKKQESNFDVVLLPLGDVEPNPENKYEPRKVEELAALIKLNGGLLHNIVVAPAGENGKHKIISGERRYRAYKLLNSEGEQGYSKIPSIIKDYQYDKMESLQLRIANASARDYTDYERMMEAADLKAILTDMKKDGYEFEGRIRDWVAQILDVSPSQVGVMENINNNLGPEGKTAFKAGEIKISAAHEIARLPKEKQPEALEVFHEQGIEGIKAIKEPVKKNATNPQPNNNEREDVIEKLKQIIRLMEQGSDAETFNQEDIKDTLERAVRLLKQKG